MNKSTLNLPRLISEVASAAAVDAVTARRFLHELFAVIETTLCKGEAITIKGIGTFHPSDDKDNPVLFQPDDELAAIANEPFAAFSAVELNDGVTDEVLRNDNSADDNEVIVINVPSSQDDIAEIAQAPSQHSPAEPEPEPVPEPIEQHAEEAELPESEPVAEPVVEPEVKSVVEVEPTPEVASEPKVMPESDDEQTPTPSPYHPQKRESQNTTLWLVLGLLIGLIIGLVGGYFAGETMANFRLPDDDSYEYESESIDLYETEPSATPQAIENEAVAAPVQSVVSEPASNVAEENAPKAKEKPEPVYDTITKTRYLSILAKEHYGSKKYWVFIYNANPQLGDPNKVSPGTRVLIPAKESFMESTTEATDAKAQKLLNELARKYKL